MPPWRMIPVLGHKLEEGWREVVANLKRILKSLVSDISTTDKRHGDEEAQGGIIST